MQRELRRNRQFDGERREIELKQSGLFIKAISNIRVNQHLLYK